MVLPMAMGTPEGLERGESSIRRVRFESSMESGGVSNCVRGSGGHRSFVLFIGEIRIVIVDEWHRFNFSVTPCYL